MNIKLTGPKLDRVRADLKDINGRFRNLLPVLKPAATQIEELMHESFRTESSPDGIPWKPLAQSTIDARARMGKMAKRRTKKGELTKGAKRIREERKAPGAMKILWINGRLENSLFARAEATKIWFGGNVKYFGPNQAGSQKKEGHPPSRPMAPVELVNGHWKLMNRGRAKEVMDSIKLSIQRYVSNGTL